MNGRYPLQVLNPWEERHMPSPYGFMGRTIITESPESVLARNIPHNTARLLDRRSRREHYVDALRIGADVVTTYLNRLPSEEQSELLKIRIDPEVSTRFFFGSKGMEISFERRLL